MLIIGLISLIAICWLLYNAGYRNGVEETIRTLKYNDYGNEISNHNTFEANILKLKMEKKMYV